MKKDVQKINIELFKKNGRYISITRTEKCVAITDSVNLFGLFLGIFDALLTINDIKLSSWNRFCFKMLKNNK
jgi:hypothetical protein